MRGREGLESGWFIGVIGKEVEIWCFECWIVGNVVEKIVLCGQQPRTHTTIKA